MTDDLATSWHDFGTAIALVEPRTGFLVAAAAAIWLSAFLADGFGFRAGAGPEMLVAPGILFVFCSALAGERFRLLSAALWLGLRRHHLRAAPQHAPGGRQRLAHHPPTRHHRRRGARRRLSRAQRHRDRPGGRARCCRAPATPR